MSSAPPQSSAAAADAAAAAEASAAKRLRIAAVVCAYFVISISLVFVNKVLMDKRYSVDAPLFMTWYQCLVTVAICWALGEYGARSPPGSFFRQFPRFSYSLATARALAPLTLVFVGMITFNNLCLQYVEVRRAPRAAGRRGGLAHRRRPVPRPRPLSLPPPPRRRSPSTTSRAR